MVSLRSVLLVAVLVLVLLWLLVPVAITRLTYSAELGRNQAWRGQLATMPAEDPMSRLFVLVAKTVAPSVVEVRVTKRVEVQQSAGSGDLLQRFFGGEGGLGPFGFQPAPRQYIERGLGSGVIVDAAKGYLITNNHVVAGANQVQVVLADGRIVHTDWIRTDPRTDLAVVKVDAGELIAAPLGDSDRMQVGDWVLAFGAPEGLQKTVTAGIISAKGRYTGDGNTYQDFLQTDAAINPGNSGGPLVNMRGQVIGINTAIVSPTGAYAGIGFAIPSDMVKSVMAQLIEKGHVTRGYLGVAIQSVTPGLARSFSLPDTKGALVTEVVPGGPAEKAGLRRGDFITSIDDKTVSGPNDLRNAVAALGPGKTVPIDFYRDGKKQSAEVTIEAQPARPPIARPSIEEGAPSERLGLQVEPMTRQLARQLGYSSVPRGVAIAQVAPGSVAEAAGLAAGMVITQVGNTEVTTPQEFDRALTDQAGAGGYRLRVTDPSGQSIFVYLQTGQ
jgi:serine protease Do